MGYPIHRYAIADPRNGRDLSSSLWRESRDRFVSADPTFGVKNFDDFQVPVAGADGSAAGGWEVNDATAGGTSPTFSTVAHPDGVRTIAATTGTAHYGAVATRSGALAADSATGLNVVLPSHASKARGRYVFETRIDLPRTAAWFIGCSIESDGFFGTSSALPDAGYIGFYKTNNGDLVFACKSVASTGVADSVTVIPSASLSTVIGATGYLKLGFAVNVDKTVDICVNGVPYLTAASGLDPAALPVGDLQVKLAVGRGGGSDGSVSAPVDFVADFIEGNS